MSRHQAGVVRLDAAQYTAQKLDLSSSSRWGGKVKSVDLSSSSSSQAGCARGGPQNKRAGAWGGRSTVAGTQQKGEGAQKQTHNKGRYEQSSKHAIKGG